ncbi:MAG: ATP-dependent DNA helicase RecG [Parcubacteria group bacterium GW2011_GWA1_47_11]|uniref:ATP-dependent DNA helicase RecG n=1 Tax=Candidatus Colwellbacteria bacterium GWA2_46_10 TaxID=1797684 RepID=A0A1G1YX06_9BACT|nr:MAG: ATP-dependent DNA helicase RecG [Parcubacteria group bacterium GW2011_GWA2_46_10]KKU55977.1 MAG: ATP-dependent DNA helicase RecG [Parcubacteria group bacterium GW2011_GWA1_47_11]OGY56130.1 MAG: ATP-dependent DNA helicase RecG [Candidatus Colwellbacteria bacterium GWA2_46_10]
MTHLRDPIDNVLSGVGKRFLGQLKKLDIKTAKDLLWHFPTRYDDRSEFLKVSELKKGGEATLRGTVQKTTTRRIPYRHLVITEVSVVDEEGSPLTVTFFNQPYIENTLKEGRVANFSGKVGTYKGKLTLQSPIYELTEIRGREKETQHTGRLVPIYKETKGITSRGLRFIIKPILENLEVLPEYIPQETLKSLNLPDVNEALQNIHFPKKEADALRAIKSFSFRDLLLLQLRNLQERAKLQKLEAYPIAYDQKELKKLFSFLPFELTASQKKSLDEILNDLERHHPMNRLLQGDVGSGKTIVAGIAALVAVNDKHQAAFMAPTEILACQHYKTLTKFFEEYDGGIALLTGKESKVFYGENLEAELKKSELIKKIASGDIGITVGTHALIQKQITFKKLGLVVIDEQHRFGVRQRAEITKTTSITPHFLSMSATPIPRTLTMTIFGNLDLSLIDELPKGRKPIITKLVDPTNRDKAYQFIKERIKSDRQAFVICPRIEESENKDQVFTSKQKAAWEVRAVKVEYEKLSKEVFPDLKVSMLHGKMKIAEKTAVMKAFVEGKCDIVVSTSVVEVGVDVPNATIMLIEGADRFGLAQLYQFRGRVGRGEHQSYCLLFTDSKTENTKARLESLIQAKNGFELAEMDLHLRGPGEFLGDTQTGTPDLTLKALQNPELLKTAKEKAEELLQNSPTLEAYPLLSKRLNQFREEVHLE